MVLLNLDALNEAAMPGGPSALTERTHLRPAGGEHVLVAPARYACDQDKTGTYVFETRFIEGKPTHTVLLDSRTSMANRMEEAISQAIETGHPVFSKMPRIQVTYEGDSRRVVESDLTLPHRAFDGHIRFGYVDGKPIDEIDAYWNARNSTPRDAFALFAISPITVLFGGWDSMRKFHQAKIPSAIVGEIIGVLADQEADQKSLITKRSGARVDPVAASINLSPETRRKIAAATKKSLGLNEKDIAKASALGLGSIPPQTRALDGIATSDIIRTYVLSFATLRRLHFGKGPEGDAAIRTLLSAMAIDAMVRADSEVFLRANAHLVEAEKPTCEMDQRMGEVLQIDPLTVEQADDLLIEAYGQAKSKAGIEWTGRLLEVAGEEGIIDTASDQENSKE